MTHSLQNSNVKCGQDDARYFERFKAKALEFRGTIISEVSSISTLLTVSFDETKIISEESSNLLH